MFCFETKTSFKKKKNMFWSKKIVSDTNSLEEFADGPDVGEFTE